MLVAITVAAHMAVGTAELQLPLFSRYNSVLVQFILLL